MILHLFEKTFLIPISLAGLLGMQIFSSPPEMIDGATFSTILDTERRLSAT